MLNRLEIARRRRLRGPPEASAQRGREAGISIGSSLTMRPCGSERVYDVTWRRREGGGIRARLPPHKAHLPLEEAGQGI